jgi:hypothetical protein
MVKLRSTSLCRIAVASISAASAADLNYSRIDELTGVKGKLNEKEAAYKISVPRTLIFRNTGRYTPAVISSEVERPLRNTLITLITLLNTSCKKHN